MLGTGIRSGIGAKLAASEREVVCVTRDGAAGFNFMEIQSAAREGLRLVTVVFAESSWTMEVPSQLMAYGCAFVTGEPLDPARAAAPLRRGLPGAALVARTRRTPSRSRART